MLEHNNLDQIFSIQDPSMMEYELGRYFAVKQFDYQQQLNARELLCWHLCRMGGEIAGDGFICLFHEIYGPEFFGSLCDALTEVGGIKLRDLLQEAWNIFTKGKNSITVDELRKISVRRFNTRELMDRFYAIGEEVVGEMQEQRVTGKVWSVEYAKLHRNEFEAIKH